MLNDSDRWMFLEPSSLPPTKFVKYINKQGEEKIKGVSISQQEYDSLVKEVKQLRLALEQAILTENTTDGHTVHMVVGNSVSHLVGEDCYICSALEE